MNLTLPSDVLYIMSLFHQAGYEIALVGGAVRDLFITDDPPTDWDFTTNAYPEQIMELFTDAFYENKFGTVGVARDVIREQLKLPSLQQREGKTDMKVIEIDTATKIHESLASQAQPTQYSPTEKNVFEITTYRSEGLYEDFRRPSTVSWGKTLEEDLQRRDFTINAMAIRITDPAVFDIFKKEAPELAIVLQNQYELVDPYHGLMDLNNQVLRTVGEPTQRFQEDALRMLRAIRLSIQLNLTIEPHTVDAIKENAALITHISWERIRDEFLKLLTYPQARAGIIQLDEVGLLQYILPELLAMKGVEQGGHHTTDVWTHSLDALAACPSRDPIVRLATLLHDIAKPQTQRFQNNTVTFYNHEIIGARMARDVARRFNLSKRDIDRIFTLVRHHMFYYQPENTDAAIRRFMRKVGLANINDIIDVRIGDRVGSGARETSWRFEEMKKRMQEQLHQPFAVTDLAIDGTDLMTEFQLQPGPQIGQILKSLFEIVVDQPELNTKEALLEQAKKLLN